MENITRKIIKENKDLWPTAPIIEKINIGFTNTIFKVNNNYIFKICTNKDNEKSFQNEINFYLNNQDNIYIPKLIKYDCSKTNVPFMYEILECLEGETLYYIWSKFSELEREEIIKELCNILKLFHKTQGKKYNWSTYITHHVEKYLAKLKDLNIFSNIEIELINKAIAKFPKYLKSTKFVLIHNDIHFDNIIYKDGKIKIIDFERSMFAPIDKELDIFLRMIDIPEKYASVEAEKEVKKEDYKNIKTYVQEYYPELFEVPNLDKRIAIYNLREYLRAYFFYQGEEEIKDKIINIAKYIISK